MLSVPGGGGDLHVPGLAGGEANQTAEGVSGLLVPWEQSPAVLVMLRFHPKGFLPVVGGVPSVLLTFSYILELQSVVMLNLPSLQTQNDT